MMRAWHVKGDDGGTKSAGSQTRQGQKGGRWACDFREGPRAGERWTDPAFKAHEYELAVVPLVGPSREAAGHHSEAENGAETGTNPVRPSAGVATHTHTNDVLVSPRLRVTDHLGNSAMAWPAVCWRLPAWPSIACCLDCRKPPLLSALTGYTVHGHVAFGRGRAPAAGSRTSGPGNVAPRTTRSSRPCRAATTGTPALTTQPARTSRAEHRGRRILDLGLI